MMKFRFSRKKNRGVAAIEFAIGFIFFWYMIAAWVEMSFMSYVSSLGDLAISRAAQVAKKYEGTNYTDDASSTEKTDNFKAKFYQTLTSEQEGSLWLSIIEPEDFTVTVKYFDTYSSLSTYDPNCDEDDTTCTSDSAPDSVDSAIAIYSISYNYTPMFNYFIDSDTIFMREMIVIQEYQRNEF